MTARSRRAFLGLPPRRETREIAATASRKPASMQMDLDPICIEVPLERA
jgi:hypothetical protein